MHIWNNTRNNNHMLFVRPTIGLGKNFRDFR